MFYLKLSPTFMMLPLWYDEDIQDNRHVDQDIVEEDRQWHNTC